jgi:hypothetical protein
VKYSHKKLLPAKRQKENVAALHPAFVTPTTCIFQGEIPLFVQEIKMKKYNRTTNRNIGSIVMDNSNAKVVPESPLNVIDFSSIIDLHAHPYFSSRLNNAPELGQTILQYALSLTEPDTMTKDSITAPCSTSTDDESDETSSIVSSLSSCHSLSDDAETSLAVRGVCKKTTDNGSTNLTLEEGRRSIFSHYWRTTGQEPIHMIQEHSQMSRSYSNPRLSSLDREEMPNDLEPVMSSLTAAPLSPSTASQRRSIFGNLDRSEPYSSIRSLPELNDTQSLARLECVRKTRSISCLRRSEPLVSCLRKSSTLDSTKNNVAVVSPSTTTTTVPSNSSSVSFDAQVQVITFQTPLEQWSNGSWSKLFGMD